VKISHLTSQRAVLSATVSLYAGDGMNASFYIACETDIYGGCQVLLGGTSVSAPAFAGIMALVNQKMQSRQGNANYVLYLSFVSLTMPGTLDAVEFHAPMPCGFQMNSRQPDSKPGVSPCTVRPPVCLAPRHD
jgi:hypothetical protein